MTIRKSGEINCSQFFMMQLLIAVFLCYTFYPATISSKNLGSAVIPILIAFVVSMITFLPIYFLNKKTKLSVMENYQEFSKGLSIIIKIIYIVYFVYVSAVLATIFLDFFADRMNQSVFKPVLIGLMCLAIIYSGLKGFEALSRSSVILFAFFVFVTIFIIIFNIPNFTLENFSQIKMFNYSSYKDSILFLVGAAFLSPVSCVLLHKVKGKKGVQAFWWTFCTYVFIAIVVLVTVGTMGNYIYSQNFPVFMISKSAMLNAIKGVDGLTFALITVSIFLGMSLMLICLNNTISKERSKLYSFVFEIIVFGIILLCIYNQNISNLILNKYVLVGLTMLTGFLLPLIILIINSYSCKKEHKNEQKN